MFLSRSRTVSRVGAALAALVMLAGCGLGTPDTVISAGDTVMTSSAAQSGAGGAGDSTAGDSTAGDSTAGDSDAESTGDETGGTSAAGAPGDSTADETVRPSGPTTKTGDSTTTRSSVGTTGSGLSGVAISATQAASAATGTHAGSKVVEIELDRAHGTTVWEVIVVSADGRWKVDVDVSTGTILANRSDDLDERAEDLDRLGRASLDHIRAIDAIVDTHPGSSLVDLSLDDEDGAVVWEAEIIAPDHQKYDITIDAATGAVLKDKLDT